MIIQAFPSGPFSTNAYVAACPKTRQAAIIDPAPNSAAEIFSFILEHQLKPAMLLLTHSHWDHIADAAKIKNKYQIPIYIHPLDAPNLQQPGSDGLPCWITIDGVRPDHFFEEGMEVECGNLKFKVIHTPGHSPGSVSLFEPAQHVLFSGDTLFKGTIGNLSFPTSQPSLMWNSLDKLAQLPSETQVFPGHGPKTTIKLENTLLRDARNLFSDT